MSHYLLFTSCYHNYMCVYVYTREGTESISITMRNEREREKERDLVNFETEFHAWPRGGLLVTVHLLLTPPALT